MLEPLVYTQDDLEKPTKMLGKLAAAVNAIIAAYNGANPEELIDVVPANVAKAFKDGRIPESEFLSSVFRTPRPLLKG